VKQFVNMWKSAFFLALSKPGVIMDRKVWKSEMPHIF
jgi:hypothetical protein